MFPVASSLEDPIPDDPSMPTESSVQEVNENHTTTPTPDSAPCTDLPSSSNIIPTRQSSRSHKRPSYLLENVRNPIYFTNLTQSCFDSPISPPICPFTALTSTNQSILNTTLTISEPTSFTQASMHPG